VKQEGTMIERKTTTDRGMDTDRGPGGAATVSV
jgi:hypothetical protein